MEELHRAAIAYYKNGDPELWSLATSFFESMDTDGDGIVNLAEFETFLVDSGYGSIDHNFFHDLDRNGDGGLDFEEVLTFYYIIKTRNLWCKGCEVRLTGLYFTCVDCFDVAGDSYDLCSDCHSDRHRYSDGQFRHHHTRFLDNHMLLRSKRAQAPGPPNLNLVINQEVHHPAAPPRDRMRRTFQALEAAIIAGNLMNMCTIM